MHNIMFHEHVFCFKACIMSNKLRYSHISGYFGVRKWGLFPWDSQFCQKKKKKKNRSKLFFSFGKLIYWVGSFGQWAGLINWVGKIVY